MFCLLPTKCKQQQIAILIISFFLHVNGIRNEGNNMLQQQQPEQQQQLLHATIENSNYQSSSSSNSIFKPSPIIEFTLADVTMPQHYKPSYEDPQYPLNIQTIMPTTHTADTGNKQNAETPKTKANNPNDNRRYSTPYTDNGEAQFLFPNQQQHVYNIPQQQQEHEHGQYQQYPSYQQQQQQQHIGTEQHLTEMPIYIYKDPYTNENYHYTPTEATILETAPPPTTTTTNSHNYNSPNAYKQQQQQQHRPTILEQDNEEYLVHSSMLVGAHAPQRPPNHYLSGDKDVYLKRPGLVYDESYVSHPNAVLDKKRDDPQITKTNKISYDSHDYPPPSYAQQQTSNFLPTPVPDRPPTPRPTQPPIRPPPAYASAAAPPPRQDYRPRPPPPPPSPQQDYAFVRPQQQQQQQQQQYLQSSQNALPNYANNLDNYLSNKQQGPYYQRERPPPAYLQQQQQQQHQDVGIPPYYESDTPPPSYRPQQPTSYPAYESPQYHHQPPPPPHRPSYNNYYDYQIGEVPPQAAGGGVNYPYPRPPNGPYRPPPPPAPTQQPSGLASLVQYAPQFTSLLLGGGGGGGSSSNANSPLGSLLGALTGAATSPQSSSSSSSSSPYNRRPINAQLIRALENIARNDDLQCVPKVLCQMIAGQTQRGQLPSFITSPTITNFLAGFPAMSPALIYGRAALLGLSGGDKSCHQTYVKCPKNEIEIIYYLNNHRGGFFKFFSEPEPQAAQVESQSPSTSLFSILAALTGSEPAQPQTTPRPRPRPPPSNSQPTSDITGTIGNFFTQLLSDYMGEGATVEYQRRRRRRSADKRVHFQKEEDDASYDFNTPIEDYNDEEDSEDTQQNVEFVYEPESENNEDDTQSRVVHRTLPDVNKVVFFPERDYIGESSGKISDDIKSLIQRFNDFNKGRKLKFPTATDERQYVDVAQDQLREAKELDVMGSYSNQYTNYESMPFKSVRDSKKVTFLENAKEPKAFQHLYLDELKDLSTSESSPGGTKVVFPEREGKILNRPNYAASYNYNQLQQSPRDEQENKFVVPNNQRPQDYDELNSPAEESYNQRPQDYDELNSPAGEIYNQRPHGFKKLYPTAGSFNQRPQVVHEFYPAVESYKPRPQGFKEFNLPTGSYNQRPQLSSTVPSSIYSSHVSSLNSVNNYVSNSATNNNYYGPSLNQGELKPSKPTTNYFLPTPAPVEDIDYDYSNSIDPNDNYNPNSQYYSQFSTNNAAHNSQKYTSSDNYNSYRPLRKPATSSAHTSSGNSKPNRGSYTSYRPPGNPSASSSSYGSSNTRRPLSSSSYNTNNSVKPQTYPSTNSQSTYDRYHSSLYTTRRPTTNTSQSPNKNIYVTNARGETEYYVTPDGRKIYL